MENFIARLSEELLIPDFTYDRKSGQIPLSVQFTDTSIAAEGTLNSWKWDFDNNGRIDTREEII